MRKRGTGRAARVFGYVGDLGVGDEVLLYRVLTWATVADLEAFCDARREKDTRELYSHQVVLGERGGVVDGGMSLPLAVEGADSWTVKLGADRLLRPLRVGETVTLLESAWRGGEGASLWQLYAQPRGSLLVTADGPHGVRLRAE